VSAPLKLPSARQPVTVQDPAGNETFTRPWFLFFQTVWERLGGGVGIDDDALLLAPQPQDYGAAYAAQQDAGQAPVWTPEQQVVVDQLQTELASQRDQIAELLKEIQALKQGYQL